MRFPKSNHSPCSVPAKFRLLLLTLIIQVALAGCTDKATQDKQTEVPRDETAVSQPVEPQPTSPVVTPEPHRAVPVDQPAPKLAEQHPSRQQLPATGKTKAPEVMLDAVQDPIQPHEQGRTLSREMVVGAMHQQPGLYQGQDRERYQELPANGIKLVNEHPFSTFSIDVDTASYANVRRLLNQGQLPRHDAVRPEEMLNYFSYPELPQPDGEHPFAVTTQVSPSPWNPNNQLMRVSLKGKEMAASELPPANLVFLVDVSGSMNAPIKLPLLQRALKLLVDSLDKEDRVALVTYAGNAGVVLESTPGDQKATINQAIDNLRSGGSTHGSAGIELAYQLAAQHKLADGINRVILASDGDLNVGTVNLEALKELVGRKRQQGIALTALGFGAGNYNDELMEQLADIGDGNAAYIDSLNEARKVLVAERGSTLHTIAKNVKIQIEFSPLVKEYRLIGYENRLLEREDFRNDKVDAGDIGTGHSVTALYELVLTGQPGAHPERRYQSGKPDADLPGQTELAYVRLRYQSPDAEATQAKGTQATELGQPVLRSSIQPLASQGDDFRWAVAVAAFAQQLKGGKHLGDYGYGEILALARNAKGLDPHGYRAEMTQMIQLAQTLTPKAVVANHSMDNDG